MPHQCVKCGAFYPDRSDEIITGCAHCHGKLFFYTKKGKDELLAEQRQHPLTAEEKTRVEEDVYDLIGDEIDRDKPVVLDLENIRVEKPGTYDLDLVSLFHEGQPLVYKLEDGKYIVDLIETFAKLRKKK